MRRSFAEEKAAVKAAYQAQLEHVEIGGHRTEVGGVVSYKFPPD